MGSISRIVADPGCLSQIRKIIHPVSRISDPGSNNRRGKNMMSYFFCSHKYHKIVNYFIFELVKKM
jgi:hypothetical protein